MTVENQTKKVTALGNDSTTVFSFSPMVINASTDLVVTKTDASNVETTLSEGATSTTYSVSVSSYPGTGSITYPASGGTALATGESITIKRLLTIEQTVDLDNQGGYFAETQETALDRTAMVDLQQQEELDRSFKWPVSYTGAVAAEIPTPVGNGGKYLKINSGATAVEWTALATTAASASDSTPTTSSLSAASAGASADFSRSDHQHLLPTISVAKGGTGAEDAATARTNLDVPSNAELTAATGVSVGDVKFHLGTTVESGWLELNGETLGSEASGADNAGTTYQDLYEHLWDNLADSEAPVSTGRGGSASADFAANKTITMPDSRGRVILGYGTGSGLTARTVGDTGGSEDAIVVSHTHGAGSYATSTDGAHTHGIPLDIDGTLGATAIGHAGNGATEDVTDQTGSSGAHDHPSLTGTSGSTGSSGTDANMPPWLAVKVLIAL